MANLVEPKGIPYLLAALSDPALKAMDLRSIIVGDGPLRGELTAESVRLGVPVTFAGTVKNSEIVRYYHEADLFVLPCVTARDGHHDGIPVSLMEAMACGVPVVSTRLSGIPELIEDNRTGILVEQKDAASLAGAIRRLVTDDDLRRRLSREGREKVIREFEIHDVARRLRELFRSCSGEGGR